MKIFHSIAAFFLLQGALCQGVPIISEFSASNANGIKDEDGSREDWIEIHNPDSVAVDLENWCLSDNAGNKAKWRFPAVSIPANGHLVVFASSKDRLISGQPLHTNFGLSANGEYLGLTEPDAVTTVSEYSPKFPKQYGDISYGIPSNTEDITVIASNASAKWLVPTSAASAGAAWMAPDHSDTTWTSATMGLGFDRNTNPVSFLPDIGSGGNLEGALFGNNATQTCYVRIPFTAPANVISLKIRVKYDDGFAVWLNGQPLRSSGAQLRRNTPSNLTWSSTASGSHDDGPASQYVDFDVSGSIPDLQAENLLAIQFLNRSSSSSDALLRVELIASVVSDSSALTPDYFAVPTPGSLNGGIDTLVIPRFVTFSKEPGVFSGSFDLELGGAEAGEEIRYTTDGSLPNSGSPVFTAPVTVSSSKLIRANLFQISGSKSGLTATAHYEKLDANLADYNGTGQAFRSALPIMVLNNLGYNGELPNDDVKRPVRVHVYDRDSSGYASFGDAPTLSSAGNAKLRGSSSSGFPKKPYSLEFTDEGGSGSDVDILGLKGEDFVLIPSWSFDKTFVRNAWIFEIARQAGHWAPRTRLVEVFFNQNNDNLSYDSATASDYRGVYVLTEGIRPDSDRVDITKMSSADTSLPGISGGLILKVDRKDSDEFGWNTDRNLPPLDWLLVYRPKLEDLNTAQKNYIVNYFQAFEDTVFSEQASGFPTRNYRKYINSQSWVDTNIFNMFPKNVDALRLSAYFTKDRGRPMEGGPLWDFDRSANNNDPGDNRDSNPIGWYGEGDATQYFQYAWWHPLFSDIEFNQLYVDRWQALRRGILLSSNINAVIDGYYQEFRSVQDPTDNPGKRDYAKWYSGAGDLTTNFTELKSWLVTRAAWIDSQFAVAPEHSLAAGPIMAGTSVSITVPSGTRVYYTLDGTDPRAVEGGITSGAVLYNSSDVIELNQTTLLTSRTFRTGSYTYPATKWSGPTQSLYTVDEPSATDENLLLTGIHLNPPPASASEIAAIPEVDASDFSWLEIRNNSNGPVNLDGMSLVKSRPVSAITLAPRTLAPGEKALIVKNREAFTLRYGSGPAVKIAGEWPRDKHLGLAEGDIRLLAKDGITRIADFTYQSKWIGEAEVVAGNSMEYISLDSSTADYQTAGNWRASEDVGGSPGEIAPEGYLAWQEEVFPGDTENVGSLDDFDGDGLANLIEYLLGSDPKEFTSNPGTIAVDDQDGLVMDYTRRADRTDAVLTVWQSTGLDLWEPAEVDELISTEGVIEHRRASFPSGGKGFLRFKGVAN